MISVSRRIDGLVTCVIVKTLIQYVLLLKLLFDGANDYCFGYFATIDDVVMISKKTKTRSV